MSEKSDAILQAAESQRQRWLKYGGNVVASSIFVILIAVFVTYAAERKPERIDMTSAGLYSLKPQTLKILSNLKAPIRIVSLYTYSKPPSNPDEEEQQTAVVPPDEAAQTVNDLLQEYANHGHGITVETIDPVTSPSKVDDLIEEVEAKYGGEVKKYKDFVQNFKPTIEQIHKVADPEVKVVNDLLPKIQNPDQDLVVTMREVIITVDQFPQNLADLEDSLQRPLRQKPPDYKGAADAITEGMSSLSNVLSAVTNNFDVLQKRGGLPPEVADYMNTSGPHFVELKKLVDDEVAKGKGLGELKLDTLRSALRERNTILVMGDKEWRAISYDQVWQPPGKTAVSAISDSPPRPRFAGEQQVTAAILGLASGGVKPKIAIVRAGGAPLTQSMNPFMGGGDAPMSDAAARLSLYNFDVVEKDLTGQFAQQGGAAEPSDDDIANALWVVWAFSGQASQFGPPPSIAPQVAAHLKAGGSAVILTAGHQDAMAQALSDWGITVRVDAPIVHEHVASEGGDATDILQQVLRLPYVFDLHEYGNHPLAKPLGSLEGLFAFLAPVQITPTKGYTATPLLPVPTAPSAPRSWGSVSYNPQDQNAAPVFDPNADITGPLYAGAAVEKDGGGRLVVLAAGDFADNQWFELTAQSIDPNAPAVIRFPGNAELFTNACFWAAHQDTLIDISPASMDIGRISEISPKMLTFLRVGVLLIGLPGAVLLAGAAVYLKRRD